MHENVSEMLMSVALEKPAPRWSVLAPVMPRGAPLRPDWHAINISETGMFVSGAPLLDAGSELEVEIALPGAFGPSLEITSHVEVVWARDPADSSINRPAGMGMHFLGIDHRMDHELKTYLHELSASQSTGKPRWSLAATVTPSSPPPALTLAATQPAPAPPPPPLGLQKGDTLGRYTIIERIGAGGMGDVFLAQHTSLGRRVAVKLLQEQYFHDRSAVRRFYDEARLVNQVAHDNIVQVTDLVVGDKQVFIVMELLVGPTLSEELDRRGPMPLSRIARIGRQLCSALNAVHQAGIIHRDLKPSNVMLVSRSSNPDFVKLLDFGIAKLREDSFDCSRTLPGQVLGTPGFIAPEQLLGEPVDARADIYSLGVVLFAMLTAQMPFIAATWTEMMLCQIRDQPRSPDVVLGKDIPKALTTVIMQCLERDPQKRPKSVTEVAGVLWRLV